MSKILRILWAGMATIYLHGQDMVADPEADFILTPESVRAEWGISPKSEIKRIELDLSGNGVLTVFLAYDGVGSKSGTVWVAYHPAGKHYVRTNGIQFREDFVRAGKVQGLNPKGGLMMFYPGKGAGVLFRSGLEPSGRLFSEEVMELTTANLEHRQLFERIFGRELGAPMPDDYFKKTRHRIIPVKDVEVRIGEKQSVEPTVAQMMALVHFERAVILAAAEDYTGAVDELKAEARMQKEFGGRLEYSTKRPDVFFEKLVTLQAQLAFKTGSDPLAGQVSYYFEKEGDGFTAARLELGDDVLGITVPDLGKEDALALVYSLSQVGGKCVAAPPRWLVVPKMGLPDALKLATGEVTFDSSGTMAVIGLAPRGETSRRSFQSDREENNAVPTRWSLIFISILAATGLLWFVLKRRS